MPASDAVPLTAAGNSSKVKYRINGEHGLRAFAAGLLEAHGSSGAAERARRTPRVGGCIARVVVGKTGDRADRCG